MHMNKFTPFEKLSKRNQRALNQKRRKDWGGINPVTRKPPDPKAYSRNKTRKWNDDSSVSGFALLMIITRETYS